MTRRIIPVMPKDGIFGWGPREKLSIEVMVTQQSPRRQIENSVE